MRCFQVTVGSEGVRPGARAERMTGRHEDTIIIFAEDETEKEGAVNKLMEDLEKSGDINIKVKKTKELEIKPGVALVIWDTGF